MGSQSQVHSPVEILAVLVTITEVAGLIQGTNSIWFIDNAAALMALVRGVSGSHSLDQMAQLVHLACFAIRSVPHF